MCWFVNTSPLPNNPLAFNHVCLDCFLTLLSSVCSRHKKSNSGGPELSNTRPSPLSVMEYCHCPLVPQKVCFSPKKIRILFHAFVSFVFYINRYPFSLKIFVNWMLSHEKVFGVEDNVYYIISSINTTLEKLSKGVQEGWSLGAIMDPSFMQWDRIRLICLYIL